MATGIKTIIAPQRHRVYQRDSSDTATITITGELAETAPTRVEARLLDGRNVLAGFDWRAISVGGRTVSGELADVPVGGPYTLELRVGEEIRRVPGILVGDLWILAGQSNMEGCGKLINLEPPSRHVNAFYYGDYWAVAKDPLCWFDEAVEPVYWTTRDPDEHLAAAKRDRAFREHGGGLGIRFGKDLYKVTGVPVGLVMCAHGGTSMEQWSTKHKDRGNDSLYGAMLRRIRLLGGKATGCLWYQGESDANVIAGKCYRQATRELIERLRADLGHPELPFLYVQLAPFLTWGAGAPRGGWWNGVQNDQMLLEREMDNIAFVSSIDSSLSDPIHIDSISQRRIGARLAKLARRMVFGHDIEIGPRPAAIAFIDDARKVIRVEYDGVNGVLKPTIGIRGFVVEKDDEPVAIKRCVRDRDGKSVLITLADPAPEGASLWYGRGLFPTVNLTDSADFAAPVFGPVPLS